MELIDSMWYEIAWYKGRKGRNIRKNVSQCVKNTQKIWWFKNLALILQRKKYTKAILR